MIAPPPEPGIERGRRLLDLGRVEEAGDSFAAVLRDHPRSTAARLGFAEVMTVLGRLTEALATLDALRAEAPHAAPVMAARALALLHSHRSAEAESEAHRAIAADPRCAAARVSRGIVLLARGGHATAALADFDTACALEPALAGAHVWRAYALEQLGWAEQAIEAHGRAVALGRQDAQALVHVGGLLVRLSRFDNAHAAFLAAAQLQPANWRAHEGVAMTLIGLRRFEAAVPALVTLRSLAPWVPDLPGHLFHARLQCCDWRDYEAARQDIARRVRAGERADAPWSFLLHNASPADQLACGRRYARDECAVSAPVARGHAPAARVRIAYLSADFHEHATSYLAAGLFERHDRSRFEVTALSYGPRTDDRMRARVTHAFERFIDVAAVADQAVAAQLAALGIDIAIDMKGHTTGGRPRILAYRPAPVQVAFLAFPGTMGCPFIDYIVADRQVLPPEDLAHYSEAPIWMPHSYQVNDVVRPPSAPATRAACGLPADAFVFACFNACYKITPTMFAVWMRILSSVESGVLWLLAGPTVAQRNLREAARHHGIAPERLIFAPPLPAEEHRRRLPLADLMLDTLPCNAHTTASDALAAGVPVLTMTGTSFAGRVATSLLTAASLRELCVRTLEDYEAMAVRIAGTPVELTALETRVLAARRCPLFAPGDYCRDFEAALLEILARHRRGEAPAPVDVAALAPRSLNGRADSAMGR